MRIESVIETSQMTQADMRRARQSCSSRMDHCRILGVLDQDHLY